METIRRIRLAIIAAVLLVGFIAATAKADPAPERDCFDTAVVGEVVKYHWLPPAAHGPNVIVLQSPVDLTTRVDQVLLGREQRQVLRVRTSLHVQFNPKIRYFLMFLRRGSDGYELVDLEIMIVRDRSGRFVVPLAVPPEEDDTSWLGAAQDRLARPIHYRPSDAWWLDREDLTESLPPTVSAGRQGLIASQGVFLDDYARSEEAKASLCGAH